MILTFKNNTGSTVITQTTDDSNYLTPVYKGCCVFVESKYESYIARQLTKIDLKFHSQHEIENINQLILTVIKELMISRKMFTIYDVCELVSLDKNAKGIDNEFIKSSVNFILKTFPVLQHIFNNNYDFYDIVKSQEGVDNILTILYAPFNKDPNVYLKDSNFKLIQKEDINQLTIQQEKEKYMATLTQRITDVIKKFIQNEEQFTLLDVSNAVKLDGGDFYRHNEIKEIAKPIMSLLVEEYVNSYEEVVINVETEKGEIVEAILYTPDYIRANDYTETNKKAVAPTKPNVICAKDYATKIVNGATPQPVTKPTASVSKNVPGFCLSAKAYKIVNVRKDGALEIPVEIITKTELNGEYITFEAYPNSIGVVDSDTSNQVLKSGIRIPKSVISTYQNTGSFYIAAFSDKLVIAPVK